MAKRSLTYLTDDDLQVLRTMIDREKKGRTNVPSRAFGFEQEAGHQAPEVYIAKPQGSSGIPALEEAPGTGGDPDTPGSVVCDIYKILDTGEAELIEVESDKLVYNVTKGTIQQEYVTIVRTKFGQWVAIDRPRLRRGVLTSELEAAGTGDSTATVQPHKWSGTDWEDDGGELTVRAFLPLASAIPSGKTIGFWNEYGVNWAILAEC